jgi:hypothetical protein
LIGAVALALGCGHGRGSTPTAPAEGSVQTAIAEPRADAAGDADVRPPPPPNRPETVPADPGPLPWTDPGAMATEILDRCRGTEPEAVLAIATEVNRGHVIERRDALSACETIFGQGTWRSVAVAAWDGRIGAVRVNHDEAWASFHDLGGGTVAVVSLRQEGGRWRFHDLYDPPRARFESWGLPL